MHRRHPFQRINLAYIIPVLFCLSLHLPAQVHAQTYQPPPQVPSSYQPYLTVQSASTFADGKALYVLGGNTVQKEISGQTFMIDLSVSWNTSSPIYKELPLVAACYSCPAAMSCDGQRWFVFAYQMGHAFDTRSNTWTKILTYNDGELGDQAASDLITGKVFIPIQTRTGQNISMMIVNSEDNTYRIDNATSVNHDGMYGITWNAVLRKVLFVNEHGMYSYTPEEGWKDFTRPPGLRATEGYCMVSSSSGSKVILFGGYSRGSNATVGDMFILDTVTLTWKNGTPDGPVRRNAACAMSGDYFVAWGGDTGNTADKIVPPQDLTIVYDLKTNKWMSDYIAPSASTTPSSQRPTESGGVTSTGVASSEGDTSGGTRLIGVIAAAVFGALAVGLVAGGVVEFRAHKKRSKLAASSVVTKRKGTVQVGEFGTRPEEQHPHTCQIAL
ncbi:hypothetical protein BGX34_001894 [Mortierella sp. NVP85]|nr:hypothetical protein BGX34_001894 [Mortierella sp. NVP85]